MTPGDPATERDAGETATRLVWGGSAVISSRVVRFWHLDEAGLSYRPRSGPLCGAGLPDERCAANPVC